MAVVKLADKVLVSNFIKGDQFAISVLIERHKGKIFNYIYSKVRDEALSHDIFQDTFVKVIKTLKKGRYNEEGKFLPWVMRIAHNLVIDHFRWQKKMPLVRPNTEFNIFDILGDESQSKEKELIDVQIAEDLKKIIEFLPDNQKEVLVMRIYNEMSFKEIAEHFDISINTALGRMRYALINLRKLIVKHNIVLIDR